MLAQAMWNAGSAMQRYQLGHGTPIPTFLRNEMADIQAFIRSRGLRAEGEVSLMPLPDPARGGEVYRAKRCGTCHRPTGHEAPDLGVSVINMTVSEISGILWNHSYAMNDRMRARGIPFPVFEGSEMADLIAYLHFLGFYKETGDPVKGRLVARDKGCASCHEGAEQKAKSLAGNASAGEPIALSAAMWNHAPEMHRLMAEKSVAWPRFDRGEMGDLAAYLRSLSARRGATER
jgi:mono/diheme cytochrome c family protein